MVASKFLDSKMTFRAQSGCRTTFDREGKLSLTAKSSRYGGGGGDFAARSFREVGRWTVVKVLVRAVRGFDVFYPQQFASTQLRDGSTLIASAPVGQTAAGHLPRNQSHSCCFNNPTPPAQLQGR